MHSEKNTFKIVMQPHHLVYPKKLYLISFLKSNPISKTFPNNNVKNCISTVSDHKYSKIKKYSKKNPKSLTKQTSKQKQKIANV